MFVHAMRMVTNEVSMSLFQTTMLMSVRLSRARASPTWTLREMETSRENRSEDFTPELQSRSFLANRFKVSG